MLIVQRIIKPLSRVAPATERGEGEGEKVENKTGEIDGIHFVQCKQTWVSFLLRGACACVCVCGCDPGPGGNMADGHALVRGRETRRNKSCAQSYRARNGPFIMRIFFLFALRSTEMHRLYCAVFGAVFPSSTVCP